MHLKELLARLPPPLRSLSVRADIGAYEQPLNSIPQLHEPTPEERRIPERFVHDIWGSRLFDVTRLRTTDGDGIEILDTGQLNRDAGPDFLNARIRIGDLDWRGDIEIHFRSSDWIAHRHQFDPRYNSVILHVTFIQDFWTGRLCRPDGSPMPEIVLRPALAVPLRKLLLTLNARTEQAFPCEAQWQTVPTDLKQGWIERLGIERVLEKKSLLLQMLPEAGSMDELVYRELMRGLGYAKNADAFFELACRVPLALLRQSDNPTVQEALLFGASGLLSTRTKTPAGNDTSDYYFVELNQLFSDINERLQIPVMSPLSWTYFRLRPSNFPTLRIAQAASWFRANGPLSSRTVDQVVAASGGDHPKKVLRHLLAAKPSEYWDHHYRFNALASQQIRNLGTGRIDTLINNVVLPLLYLVAEQNGDRTLARSTRHLASELPVQSTEITRRFSSAGFKPKNAAESRGLHQLYRTRCTASGCLSCAIGRHLLRANIR